MPDDERAPRARLLKRVFELDLEHCPSCGGELTIIAAILEQPVTEKMFTHAGLQAHASDCFEVMNSGQAMWPMVRLDDAIATFATRGAATLVVMVSVAVTKRSFDLVGSFAIAIQAIANDPSREAERVVWPR